MVLKRKRTSEENGGEPETKKVKVTMGGKEKFSFVSPLGTDPRTHKNTESVLPAYTRWKKGFGTMRRKILRHKLFRKMKALELYVGPEPTRVKDDEPWVESLPSVPLICYEYVAVKIRGTPTYLFLDSGSTTSFMEHEEAKRLNIKPDFYKTSTTVVPNGVVSNRIGVVKKEVVEFEGGLKMNMCLKVFAEDRDDRITSQPIILGQDALENYKVIQVFDKEGGRLYFQPRKPLFKRLEPEILFSRSGHGKQLTVAAHTDRSREEDCYVDTLLDTGCPLSMVSTDLCDGRGMASLEVEVDGSRLEVVKVKLHMNGRSSFTVPAFVVDAIHPFKLGLDFLAASRAVIDYYKSELYLQTTSSKIRHRVVLHPKVYRFRLIDD